MKNNKIAFLSTDNLDDFFVWDNLCEQAFCNAGITIVTVPWRRETTSWADYDAVIVRSTWDYQDDLDNFIQVLKDIDQHSTLLNPLGLQLWNISKTYLQRLAQLGVKIIDSEFFTSLPSLQDMTDLFEQFNAQEIIIKPCVSANSDNTYRLTRSLLKEKLSELQQIFAQRDGMIQPFIRSVIDDGEYSLFYFNGDYSHTIKKVPKAHDFRVQEEHGGSLHTVQPTSALLASAQQVMASLPYASLYARVDLVWVNTHWALMEVELIEPSLYFNMDDESPQRFVDATLHYLDSLNK